MYIHGEFRDKDDKVCSVHILSDNDKTTEVVIGENGLYFGDEPVTIETDIDDTFSTLIQRSAKIGLVTKDYIGTKLFANNARNIKVNIYKGSACIFAGYVEPTSFTQPFVTLADEFDINCTDGISTLQYYSYNNANADSFAALAQEGETKSFYDIMSKAFTDLINEDIVGSTTGHIYYDLSKAISSGRESTVFADLGIAEAYLYGSDMDDCMTYDAILEQMLQYLNLHIIQIGFDFYIFDWNTLRNGRTEWKDLLSTSTETHTQKTIALVSSMHSDSDTSISFSDVYNQISVKDTLEDIEDVIESPLDSDSLSSYFSGKVKYMTEYISEGSGDTAHDAMWNMLQGLATDYENAKEIDWYMQPMYNKNWKLCYESGKDINTLLEKSGDTYINPYKVAKYLKDHALTPCIFRMGSVERKSKATDNSPTAKIDMDDYLFISINGNETDSDSGVSPQPADIKAHEGMIEYTGNSNGIIYSPADDETTNYLVFQGKILLQPIAYESSPTYAARAGSFQAILDNKGLLKTESISAQVPDYKLFVPFGDFLSKSNLVKSDNNDEGRYYSRKWYTDENPRQHSDSNYLKSGASLQPWTKDKSAHGYEYNFTDKGDGTDKFYKVPILECQLMIGNKYLVETVMDTTTTDEDDTKFEWLTEAEIEERTDLTYADDDGTTQYKRTFSLGFNPKIGDNIIGDEYDIQNNISYTMNLDVEGTAIPIKRSDKLSGKISFKILGPINTIWNNFLRRHPSFWRHTSWTTDCHSILAHTENIIIKDFTCKIVTDNAGYTNTQDNDLIYMSNENHTYVEKKDAIEFKFITQPTSAECTEKGIKNTVNINGVVDMTTGLYSESLYNATTAETAKAEEHYVDQYYTEYNKPKVLMTTSLHNSDRIDFRDKLTSSVLGMSFFVQSMNEDVKQCSTELTLKQI